MFHKEGYPSIALATLVLVLCVWLGMSIESKVLGSLPIIAGVFLWIIILQFFRNPKRNTPKSEKGILAPSDGTVVKIEPFTDHEYFGEPRTLVSIFMSPLNVHVNRNPVSGVVNYFKYHPGKYLVAWHPKSSTENERTTTVIKTDGGVDVLFRQIAGAVARRIRWYVKTKDNVTQGNEMGFIKFGSRVDVFVPIGSDINVEIGQKVKAAESLLGVLK